MKKLIFIFALMLGLSLASDTFAGQYDIKNMTPEIKQALSNRQARFGDLGTLKQSGAIGENNKGYVTAFANKAVSDAVARAENEDRKVIYQAIVDQNGLGAGGMTQVEQVFADVQRGRAKAGEKIQLPNGNWVQK